MRRLISDSLVLIVTLTEDAIIHTVNCVQSRDVFQENGVCRGTSVLLKHVSRLDTIYCMNNSIFSVCDNQHQGVTY